MKNVKPLEEAEDEGLVDLLLHVCVACLLLSLFVSFSVLFVSFCLW